MDGIASIGLSELRRMSTRGLLKMIVVCFMKSRDGRMMNASDGGGLTISMARIKKREDIIVLSRGERLHG
jgi:hypothetical protein